MLKKSFVGLLVPQFQYQLLPTRLPDPERVTASKTVTLYHPKKTDQKASTSFKVGDKVKTGQKISLYADNPAYIIASAAGTISAISPHAGDFGKTYSAVTIDIDKNETIDDQFDGILLTDATLQGFGAKERRQRPATGLTIE